MPARPIVSRTLVWLALLTAAPVAWGQLGEGAELPGGTGDADGAGPSRSEDVVQVRTASSRSGVEPGGSIELAVVLEIDKPYHVNPNKPDEDFLIPTTVEVVEAPEAVRPGAPVYPEGHTIDFGPKGAKQKITVYSGEPVIYLPLSVAEGAEPGELSLRLKVGYQACDDKICLRPSETERTATLPVVADASKIEPANEKLFADYERPAAATGSDGGGDGGARTQADTAASGNAAESTAGGAPAAAPSGGLLITALLAALGGLVLNLTPCVLPVIPIKVLTLKQHAGSRGRTLYLGVWMAVGVVAFWVGAGLPMVVFSGATDPSRLFGIWWLTVGLGLLIALMGLGVMGLFTLQLPQAVYQVNPKADTAWGSFLFGVMTAVLGLPCFGFVAGGLLAGSATLPASTVMTIFAALGVGMAAPYLLLAMFPKLVDSIPKTGPASELVKQIMGLLLLGAAAYFIGSGLIALVGDAPYVGRQLHWWAVALLAALAGGWLILRTFQITGSAPRRAVFTVIGLALAGSVVYYATDSTLEAREKYMIRAEARAEADATQPIITTTWMEYEPGLVERAQERGYTVVMDFTAEWCLNCKYLKATVLESSEVKRRLQRDDTVAITVDLTSSNAPGWDLLESYGKTGIPLLVIEGPGLKEPWMANRYTGSDVLAAVKRATSDQRTAAR